jgi:tRNA(Ile)-lysidine synthase
MLNEQFPGASNAIASTMAMLGDNEAIYREAIDNARSRYVANNTIDLQSLISNELQAATVLFELIRPMGFNYTQACDIIAANSSGRQFFAGRNILTIHRGSLIITDQPDGKPDEYSIDLCQPVTHPINLSVSITPNDGTVAKPSSASTIMLDAAVLDGNPHFVLRHWRNGDRIAPFGMNGTKKLSDIFTDAHLSIIDKENVWVLTRNDEILWVIGHRTSRHYPVTPSSTHIITISTNE